jgi:hypothetical protein
MHVFFLENEKPKTFILDFSTINQFLINTNAL